MSSVWQSRNADMRVRVDRDRNLTHAHITDVLKIPRYKGFGEPPVPGQIGDEAGMEGDVIVDRNTGLFCWHDGITWRCALDSNAIIQTTLRGVGCSPEASPGSFSLVVNGNGPDLEIANLAAGPGIVLDDTAGCLEISAPPQGVDIQNAVCSPVGYELVNTSGAPLNYTVAGLLDGPGIEIDQVGECLQISAPPSVTVENAICSPAGFDLVDTTGAPFNYIVRGLIEGSGIDIQQVGECLEISAIQQPQVTVENAICSPAGFDLVDISGAPFNYIVRGLIEGSGIDIQQVGECLEINSLGVTVENAICSPAGFDLVDTTGAPFSYIVRGLIEGQGITISQVGECLEISADAQPQQVTVDNTACSPTADAELVVPNSGPNYLIRGLVAGDGVEIFQNPNDECVTIQVQQSPPLNVEHPWELQPENVVGGSQLQNMRPNNSFPYMENGIENDNQQNLLFGSDFINSTSVFPPPGQGYNGTRMFFLGGISPTTDLAPNPPLDFPSPPLGTNGAFRAGITTSDQWDLNNVGYASTANGQSTIAAGDFSAVCGGANNIVTADSFASFIGGGCGIEPITGVDGSYTATSTVVTGPPPAVDATFDYDIVGGIVDLKSITLNNGGSGYDTITNSPVTITVNGVEIFIQVLFYTNPTAGIFRFEVLTRYGNRTEGPYSVIGGGTGNKLTGGFDVIGGGECNICTNGDHSIVVGGKYNSIEGSYSIIGGGGGDNPNLFGQILDNRIFTNHGTVCGGGGNRIVPASANPQLSFLEFATICGGLNNTITTQSSTQGRYGFIGGGLRNTIVSNYCTIGGGIENMCGIGDRITVGGGAENECLSYAGTIAGGELNRVEYFAGVSTIGGGQRNHIFGGIEKLSSAVISGGNRNIIHQVLTATIGGGAGNQLGVNDEWNYDNGGSGQYDNLHCSTTIAGGDQNLTQAWASSVVGGEQNVAIGKKAVIGGGGDIFAAPEGGPIGTLSPGPPYNDPYVFNSTTVLGSGSGAVFEFFITAMGVVLQPVSGGAILPVFGDIPGITVTNGGTGYAIGDVIEIQPGDYVSGGGGDPGLSCPLQIYVVKVDNNTPGGTGPLLLPSANQDLSFHVANRTGNLAVGISSTISGGGGISDCGSPPDLNPINGNEAYANWSTICGGGGNTTGGRGNTKLNQYSDIGEFATVCGGLRNEVIGAHSFGAGHDVIVGIPPVESPPTAPTAHDDTAVFGLGTSSNFTASGGANQFIVNTGGSFTAAPASGVYINPIPANTGGLPLEIDNASGLVVTAAPSSQRFKKDIVNLETVLDSKQTVSQLRPVKFKYKENDRAAYGLIAEEVYPLLPEVVPLDAEGLPYSVRYDHLVPLLLAEVKRLQGIEDKYDSLLARIEKLERQ